MAETSWQRIAEAVVQKCLRGAEVRLTGGGRLVLASIVMRAARDEVMPTEEEFAAEMGMSVRTFRRYVNQELADACGFVYLAPGGRGGARYLVQWRELERWVGLAPLENPAKTDMAVQPMAGFRAEETGQNRHDRAASDRLSSRARAASAAAVVADPGAIAAEAEAFEQLQRHAVAVLRSGGVKMPHLMHKRLEGWLRKGLTLEDIQLAAEKAAAAGVNRFDYCEPIFEELLNGPIEDPVNVTKFEHHRGLRPWVGA